MVVADGSPGDGANAGLRGLEADRLLLGRSSTAELVADILRSRIAEGYFLPGARLPEDAIGGALGVSRNTLREAFRLLTHERLLAHELNRGVFVRRLALDDLIDLYRVRQIVECAAVRTVGSPLPDLTSIRTEVKAGRSAARRRAWRDLGTANIRFHQAIAGLAGSSRVDEIMRGLLAELRLVFHVMADPRRFHEPYLDRNVEILQVLERGDGRTAERLLGRYLDDALAQLVEAYAERDSTAQ
ncbi:GntR family transcriptional regulator [Actinopolymorpha alba]|uniref:GntR family transcriptional regulator n=1 Tax=Actinopolymorpha alba TaxID=533267 RepID=UPI000476AF6F|nr:GntR family transcriptional regulator [Actinopolymorpha alba]